MKVALVIMDGHEQIVLTPETAFEKTMLDKLDRDRVSIKRGSFYHCQGGWYRQGSDDSSTILVLSKDKDKDSDVDTGEAA